MHPGLIALASFLSFFVVFRAADNLWNKVDWTARGLKVDQIYVAAREGMANVQPYTFLHNKTYSLADGSTIVVPVHFPIRTHDGVPNMFTYPLQNSGLFYFHNLPVIPWAVLAPTQMSSYLRKHYLSMHRWIGRLVLACSLSMTVSGAVWYPMKLGMASQSDLAFSLPELASGLSSIFMTTTLWKALVSARAKDIVAHRRWAVRHLGVGYGIAFVRLYTVAAFAVVSMLRPHIAALRSTGPEAWAVERLIFGLNWLLGLFTGMGFAEAFLAFAETPGGVKEA